MLVYVSGLTGHRAQAASQHDVLRERWAADCMQRGPDPEVDGKEDGAPPQPSKCQPSERQPPAPRPPTAASHSAASTASI
ncbi:unnamed protein product [Gongylonema pulchrum]|uniref:BRCT domain-containing protein n=1 Tax=Gongylonema pulchrum TaxID=637853 RepID=A0A183EY58_9BILA|nr:unnamed protein product [Gongylonema pulchrum]